MRMGDYGNGVAIFEIDALEVDSAITIVMLRLFVRNSVGFFHCWLVSIVRGQTRGKVCRLQRSTDGTCCAGARTLYLLGGDALEQDRPAPGADALVAAVILTEPHHALVVLPLAVVDFDLLLCLFLFPLLHFLAVDGEDFAAGLGDGLLHFVGCHSGV